MEQEKKILNEQLVEIFENILRIEHDFMQRKTDKRLSMAEIHTISAIGVDSLYSMGEIAKKLHITVGTLTVAVNNLVKKKYVERFKSEQDRRIVKIGLTKMGKEIYHIHEKFHNDLGNSLMNNLSKEEQDTVCKAIKNLENFIEMGYMEMDI